MRPEWWLASEAADRVSRIGIIVVCVLMWGLLVWHHGRSVGRHEGEREGTARAELAIATAQEALTSAQHAREFCVPCDEPRRVSR